MAQLYDSWLDLEAPLPAEMGLPEPRRRRIGAGGSIHDERTPRSVVIEMSLDGASYEEIRGHLRLEHGLTEHEVWLLVKMVTGHTSEDRTVRRRGLRRLLRR